MLRPVLPFGTEAVSRLLEAVSPLLESGVRPLFRVEMFWVFGRVFVV